MQEGYDQLKLSGMAATKELARQIQSYVGACSDPDNVSWSDSRFFTDSHRAGDAWCRFLGGTLLVKLRSPGKTSPLNDAFVDACGGMLEVQVATVLPRGQAYTPGADGAERINGQWRRRGPATGEITSLLAATLGSSGGVVAGLAGFWRSWCGAAVRLCQTFAGSLLVKGQSSGN